MSYLFHKTHEQSYVAHVIGYSMCIGPYANVKECRHHTTNNAVPFIFSLKVVLISILLHLMSFIM